MKKHLIKTVLATLLSFVLAGSALFSNAVFAASDPELVKVPGGTLDLTNKTYNVLDLTHPDIEKFVTKNDSLMQSVREIKIPSKSKRVRLLVLVRQGCILCRSTVLPTGEWKPICLKTIQTKRINP